VLRFAVLDGLPGGGKVHKEMKNDVRDERRADCYALRRCIPSRMPA
jgi:hypothetical protein